MKFRQLFNKMRERNYRPVSTKVEQEGRVRRHRMVVPEMNLPINKVLIIDDDIHAIKVMSRSIQHLGYEPVIASGGEEAIELYRKNPDITAAIIDYSMPSMNGIETYVALKEVNPNIKGVLCTGWDIDTGSLLYNEMILAGMESNYLQKPVRLATLKNVLEKIVGGQ